MIYNIWLNDTYTTYATLDDALRDFGKNPYDLSITFDSYDSGVSRYTVSEMEEMLRDMQRDIRDEKRHNDSLAAE